MGAQTIEGSGGSARRGAERRFLISSGAVLLVLVAASVLVASLVARQTAVDINRRAAAAAAEKVVGPKVTPELRAGAPDAIAALDAAVADRLADGSVTRIKIWDVDGRILWSDRNEIIGRTFPLPDEVEELAGTTGTVAELSDLDRAENVTERDHGELIEVYAGAFDAAGEPFVYEAYGPADSIAAERRAVTIAVLSVALGGLLLFAVASVPLALSLARRVDAGQEQQSRLTRQALEASDAERRRLVRSLHDWLIPDLAGVGYALAAIRRVLPGGSAEHETADRVGRILTDDIERLRTTLTDLYPPDLTTPGGFRAAIEQLATDSGETPVEIELPDDLMIGGEAAVMAYRVAREGLRNVGRHAEATAATVAVHQGDGHVTVTVTDDGRGIGPDAMDRPDRWGLALLRDALEDLGGTLDVSALAAGGTRLAARFPQHPAG